jgi:hypothetical protein
VTFSLDDVLYMELVKRGRNRGLSPHQVAKEIVVSHLLSFSSELNMGAKYPSYSSDVNIPAIAPNYTSEINIGNKYPIYSSDIYMEHKAPTYSSDVNIGNRAGQDPISVDELVQRIADLLEKRARTVFTDFIWAPARAIFMGSKYATARMALAVSIHIPARTI